MSSEVKLQRSLRSYKQSFCIDRSCLICGEGFKLPFKVPSSTAGLSWKISIAAVNDQGTNVSPDSSPYLHISLISDWKDDPTKKPAIMAETVMTITHSTLKPTLKKPKKQVSRFLMARVRGESSLFSVTYPTCQGDMPWSNLNEVILTIELTYGDGPMEIVEIHNPDFNLNISEKLGAMYDSNKLTDVTFDVEGHKIPAHRAILGAMCESFAAMFQHDLLESVSGIVKIVDCDPNVFREMIKFIYTGTEPLWSDNSIDFALALHQVADKYGLVHLCTRCQMQLLRCLSPDNVFKLLLSSETMGPKIFQVAFDYLKNNSEVVLASEAWQGFLEATPRLAANILLKLVTKMDALPPIPQSKDCGESKRARIE